jgi:hypothetical protein
MLDRITETFGIAQPRRSWRAKLGLGERAKGPDLP